MPQGPGTYDEPGRPKKAKNIFKKAIGFIKKKKNKKKKKKIHRSGEDYGQIPTGNGTENPVGGN